MSARRFPADDRYDEHGQDRWAHPDEEGYRRDMVAGGDEVRRLLRCPLCGKTLDARPDCATCGDETDVERDGPDADRSCPRSEGSSASATTGRGSSGPGRVPVSLSARRDAG